MGMLNWKLLLRCSVTGLFCAMASFAQVKITKQKDRIAVEIGGKPFGDFIYGSGTPKPYFAPLRSASGTIVTRKYPMEEVAGESRDHRHHRGLWIGYKDVNGFNFWENEFSYHNPKAGTLVVRKIDDARGGKKEGSIRATIAWVDPTGKTLLTENRTMTFHDDPKLRIIDVESVLKADAESTFGDDKDGTFAVRIADSMTEKHGGTIVNSDGGHGMKECWGKKANWVDYTGDAGGEKVGIAMFDNPDSFRHPVRWHVRDYGLFAANPFGAHAYDSSAAVSSVVLKPGQSVKLHYRVVIHPPMDASAIERMYRDWAK